MREVETSPHALSVPSPACGGGLGRGQARKGVATVAPSPPLPRKRGREQAVPVAWSCLTLHLAQQTTSTAKQAPELDLGPIDHAASIFQHNRIEMTAAAASRGATLLVFEGAKPCLNATTNPPQPTPRAAAASCSARPRSR